MDAKKQGLPMFLFMAYTAAINLIAGNSGKNEMSKEIYKNLNQAQVQYIDLDGDERKDFAIVTPNAQPLVYLQQPDGSYLPLQIVEEKLWNQRVNPARDLDARVQHSLDALHQK